MKNLFVIILLVASYTAKSQDTVNTAKGNICNSITLDQDKFTGEKTYYTPTYGIFEITTGPPATALSYSKTISKGKATYYILLQTESSIAASTNYGVIILLKNGKKINKPSAKVSTDVDSHARYIRSSFIRLTDIDIALLKTSPVTDFKLYVDDASVEHPEQYMQLFNCLISKK